MSKIDQKKISHEMLLEGGYRLVLLNCLDDPKSYPKDWIHRNLYKLDPDDLVVWQVQDYQPMSNSTFTNLYKKDGLICAYNFDGIEYVVDANVGRATPRQLLK